MEVIRERGRRKRRKGRQRRKLCLPMFPGHRYQQGCSSLLSAPNENLTSLPLTVSWACLQLSVLSKVMEKML